jgi:hypothetical protein
LIQINFTVRQAGTFMSAMSYEAKDFLTRAEECVRLANATKDEMIRKELLLLRQVYLRTAERLGAMNRSVGAS